VRISEILRRSDKSTKRRRARPVGVHSRKNLTQLANDLTKEGRLKHSRNLNWSRAFLSKTRFMAGRQCPKKLWLATYNPAPAEEPLPGTRKGMGIEVGVKARLLWPAGVLVDTKWNEYSEAIERTKALVADPTILTIFEAALAHDGVLVRIDALERLPDGRWRLNEVKSSTRIKDELLEDVALQAYVIAGNGLDLADAYLVYIDGKYTRGEEIDWNELFRRDDVTEDVIRLLPELPERIAKMHEVLCQTEAPDTRPSRHCFRPVDCEFWHLCTSHKPADWVFNIPRLSPADFNELESVGVVSMRDVPMDFRLSPSQKRLVDAAKSGNVYRSPELAKLLPPLAPPVGYLDFETFSPAVPIYINTVPYQRIPFQFSWHYNNGCGSLTHAEFLAHGDTDPRREFAQTLLRVSGEFRGTVLVWSRFEEDVIRDMAELFPDLAERLIALVYRIVDLLQIVRDHVAHPDFQGSFSMKAVAPAVAPDLTYSDLDIADGGDASAAFYRIIADPTLSPEARDGVRRSLLQYCQRDTLALARVHQWLIQES
jgi:predicted RecB family nuclease